jgi:hypothetical protein
VQLLPRGGRLWSLVGPGNRQPEKAPALHELSGRPTTELTTERLPVIGFDSRLDQRRQGGDVLGPGQVEHHPTVTAPFESSRATNRDGTTTVKSSAGGPLGQQRWTVDRHLVTEPSGHRRQIRRRRGRCDDQTGRPNQRRAVDPAGQRHCATVGPGRHLIDFRHGADASEAPTDFPPTASRARLRNADRRTKGESNMVELKPGARFQSTVCSTEVIVVKGAGEVDLTCGGAPMVASGTGEISGSPSGDAAGGTQLGKRYGNADETIELLATKAGDGSLAADGGALEIAQAKTLPASD